MTPLREDLNGEELGRAVARAVDVAPRRQAAALLLLELVHDEAVFDVDEVPDDVLALLAPLRMAAR
jgi:hypothetical protein